MKQTRRENTRAQLLFFVFHRNSVPIHGSDVIVGLRGNSRPDYAYIYILRSSYLDMQIFIFESNT